MGEADKTRRAFCCIIPSMARRRREKWSSDKNELWLTSAAVTLPFIFFIVLLGFMSSLVISSENLRLGMLMGFQMSVMCIGQLVMQSSVNGLGTTAIAGYTAATKVDQLSVLVNNAFITAIAAYVAQNHGAGDIGRIRKGVWASLLLTETTDVLMMLIIIIIQPFIVPMFVSSPSPEVFIFARDFFLVTLPFYPVLGLLCVYRTSVQSLGNSWAPFTACIVELIARCSASLLLGAFFGYIGIVFSSPLAWIGADAIVIPAYAMTIRKLAAGKP